MRLPAGQVAFVRVHAVCMGVLFLGTIAGCETPAQKERKATLNRPAAEEMTRICALRGEERVAELKKLKEQTGLELFCPSD